MDDDLIFMVVDDCETNRVLLKMILDRLFSGCLVLEAENGKQSVEMYTRAIESGYKINTIFMDQMMPVMIGSTAIRKMCEFHKNTKNKALSKLETKFVIITADQTFKVDNEEDCGSDNFCGNCAVDVFYKPIRKEQIRKIVLGDN